MANRGEENNETGDRGETPDDLTARLGPSVENTGSTDRFRSSGWPRPGNSEVVLPSNRKTLQEGLCSVCFGAHS